MPTSIGTAVAFAMLIVPGFMAVSGFSASRARSSPDRDLYAVAQAVVVSLVWLLGAYLVQAELFGNPAEDWGVLPFDDAKIASHREQIAVAGLLLLVVGPFAAGAAWGGLLNAARHRGGDALDRPDAWEAAWAWARDHARKRRRDSSPKAPVYVEAKLSDGRVIQGVSARDMDVAYPPQTTRDFFLREATEYAPDGSVMRRSTLGAFVTGSTIVTVFFSTGPPAPVAPTAPAERPHV